MEGGLGERDQREYICLKRGFASSPAVVSRRNWLALPRPILDVHRHNRPSPPCIMNEAYCGCITVWTLRDAQRHARIISNLSRASVCILQERRFNAVGSSAPKEV